MISVVAIAGDGLAGHDLWTTLLIVVYGLRATPSPELGRQGSHGLWENILFRSTRSRTFFFYLFLLHFRCRLFPRCISNLSPLRTIPSRSFDCFFFPHFIFLYFYLFVLGLLYIGFDSFSGLEYNLFLFFFLPFYED